MKDSFRIQMHCHTKHGSADSVLDIPDIIETCLHTDIHAVCLTDHHNYQGWLEAAQYQIDTSVKLFFGIELRAIEGDILVYSKEMIKWPPYAKAYSQQLIDIANEHDAFVVIPHPFRQNGPVPNAVGDVIDTLTGFHGVEVWNGRNNITENLHAQDWMLWRKRFPLRTFAGGDAHERSAISEEIMTFTDSPKNQDEFVDMLFHGLEKKWLA